MFKKIILSFVVTLFTLVTYSFSNLSAENTNTSYASYYHTKFNGRKTASGELFDSSKLTAAHRTLPFGTEIKVTNLKNGKEVTVEINDRGPFHSSRILDMSKAAFAEIAHPNEGKVPVSFEVLN